MQLSHQLNVTSPKPAKIVADGGLQNYDYINKALFLGADYCMCGRLFSQC
jgi:isopentenyl diphosphate isomerase/L-lactate dehydrogenase-like FMN-dependent dehydrogenase